MFQYEVKNPPTLNKTHPIARDMARKENV